MLYIQKGKEDVFVCQQFNKTQATNVLRRPVDSNVNRRTNTHFLNDYQCNLFFLCLSRFRPLYTLSSQIVELVLRHVVLILISVLTNTKMQLLCHFVGTLTSDSLCQSFLCILRVRLTVSVCMWICVYNVQLVNGLIVMRSVCTKINRKIVAESIKYIVLYFVLFASMACSTFSYIGTSQQFVWFSAAP